MKFITKTIYIVEFFSFLFYIFSLFFSPAKTFPIAISTTLASAVVFFLPSASVSELAISIAFD